MNLITDLTQPYIHLYEKIFHNHELKRLRACKTMLDGLLDNLKRRNFVILNHLEKLVIREALINPHFIDKVREPKTKYIFRKVYQALLGKFPKEK